MDFLRENWQDIPRFILGGVIVACFVTTIPMAVAAFTERRAYAAAFVIAAFVITTPMSTLLTTEWCETSSVTYAVDRGEVVAEYGEEDCGSITGDNAKWFALLDVGRAPTHLIDQLFSTMAEDDQTAVAIAELPVAVPIAWYAFLVVFPGAILLLRYRRLKA